MYTVQSAKVMALYEVVLTWHDLHNACWAEIMPLSAQSLVLPVAPMRILWESLW